MHAWTELDWLVQCLVVCNTCPTSNALEANPSKQATAYTMHNHKSKQVGPCILYESIQMSSVGSFKIGYLRFVCCFYTTLGIA